MKIKFDILNNFISPVTGRVLADYNYILLGNRQGIATPSPALTDVKLDLINLRRDYDICASASFIIGFPNAQLPNAQILNSLPDGILYNTAGVISTTGVIPPSALPDLTKGNLWIGNDENRPVEITILPIANMANLNNNNIWIGNSDNRPVAKSTINSNNLPNLNRRNMWLGDSDDRPEQKHQIFEENLPDLGVYIGLDPLLEDRGKIWRGTFDPFTLESGTEKSDDLSKLEIDVDEIDADIIVINAEIATLQGQIAVLQGQIATLQGEVGALSASVATIQGQIVVIDDQITNLNNRIDNLRLNTIPANGDVSFYNYKLINLANPVSPQDGATKLYVDNAISGGISTITLTGFVEGGPPVSGVINTIRTPGDLDMGGDRVKNLQQDPEEDFDAVSFTFLWNLMHDEVNIIWP